MIMVASRRNPYIIGRPVNEPDRFFDREPLLEFIADSLSQKAPVILLHGQRRIGKSSVLAQIPHWLKAEPFTFIALSLEGKSHKCLPEVLHDLAKETLQSLDCLNRVPIVPSIADLKENPGSFNRFLENLSTCCDRPELVLLLDEFDTLGNYQPDAAAYHLFPFLAETLQQQRFLHIIPVVGRRLEDLPTLLNLFKSAPAQEISLLDRASATQLITEPAQGILTYAEDAITAIFDLCAGHPYFTQVICFAIFTQARQDDRWDVTAEDVYRVVDRAIELGEGGLAWFWDGLPIAERVLYSAAAEVAEKSSTGVDANPTIREGDPLALLEEWGVSLTDCLHKAQQNLIEWKFLKRIKKADSPETVSRGTYQIMIELVRRWLVRQHSIRDEIWELENLNPDLQSVYEEGRERRYQGELSEAISLYERVLAENPNHFSSLFDLADCLLQNRAYAQALKLFDRAYYVDPFRAREGLMRSGLGHAKTLMERSQIAEAEKVLDRLLEMDAENPEVRSFLAEIAAQKTQTLQIQQSWGKFIPEWKWNLSKQSSDLPPQD